MADTLEQMTKFYDAIENLPISDPKNFSFLSRKKVSSKNYFHITTKNTNYKYEGMGGRIHLWDYTLLKMLEKFGYNFGNGKITNRFYRSRLRFHDENTDTELKIWSPKGDMLLSYLLGNRFKGKLEKRNKKRD